MVMFRYLHPLEFSADVPSSNAVCKGSPVVDSPGERPRSGGLESLFSNMALRFRTPPDICAKVMRDVDGLRDGGCFFLSRQVDGARPSQSHLPQIPNTKSCLLCCQIETSSRVGMKMSKVSCMRLTD